VTIQSMAEALAARDEGIASSMAHANDDAPGWSQRAYDNIARNPGLKRHAGFTMEVARAYAWGHGLDSPPDLRAWGGVTLRLIRDGVLVRIGYAPAASSHGSPKALYRIRTHGESE
jgi:hypothetical protein